MVGNVLYYGDNLEVLRERVGTETIDLVYLDPPFNSNRSYNVLFRRRSGEEAQAQIEAFDDTWTWSQESERQYEDLVAGGAPVRVADAVQAMRRLLGDNDVLAYLVMMTARLVELHRVLKHTGSLYLHCDPTASHYLKILLDAVFGPERFLAEVIWKRTSAHNRVRRFGPVHDTILGYAKGTDWTWNPIYVPYDREYIDRDYRRVEPGTGRRYRISDLTSNNPGSRYEFHGLLPPGGRYWAYAKETLERFESEGRIVWSSNGYPQYKRYLDEMPGQMAQDLWTDVPQINNRSRERLGYPTQKPVTLLERIIQASSDSGQVVLDPFCGCGTTVDAAQKLGRRWIGIDITYLAIDLINKRLKATYGEDIVGTYSIRGIPHDLDGARALFEANPFDFERWVVSLMDGQANEKQVGDKGLDGIIRFPIDNQTGTGRALVSVKGGRQVNPGMVRDLVGTVQQQHAEMGIFVCMTEPTSGMLEVARKSGSYVWQVSGRQYPKVQVLRVSELLAGKRPDMPTPFLPYVQARRLVPGHPTLF